MLEAIVAVAKGGKPTKSGDYPIMRDILNGLGYFVQKARVRGTWVEVIGADDILRTLADHLGVYEVRSEKLPELLTFNLLDVLEAHLKQRGDL